jgi:hypothetical protein
MFDLVDRLDTASIEDITADAVSRIRWIGNHPALLQNLYDPLDKAFLGIVLVDL